MSGNVILISPWVEHLCIEVINGQNSTVQIDFNRFRYHSVPTSKVIKNKTPKLVGRDELVSRLFSVIAEHPDHSEPTKCNLFGCVRRHLKYCDHHSLSPFTKEAVQHELCQLNNRQQRGEIKDSSETILRSELASVLGLLDLPAKSWLPAIPTSGKSQMESAEGYSNGDLKKKLPLLRALFKQLNTQFMADPGTHLASSANTATMTFNWMGNTYPVRSGINKLFSVATYLLAYYTWSNSKQLYDLKRPQTVSHSLSDEWYQMPAFKRRSFKTFTVEIGANDRLEIPKYALQFFDKLLAASKTLNSGADALLLASFSGGKIVPMNGSKLSSLNSWLDKQFPMVDDRGERLWPVVRRFRATGSQLTQARKGPVQAAMLLENTPNVIKASYSSGNRHENNQMMRDTAQTMEQSARDRQGVEAAKQAVRDAQQVEVLAYEAFVAKATPPSRNSHGSYCKDPFGKQSEAFTRHARQRGLLGEGERLACADLLACFGCEHQVLVESVDDIWCLLSFSECIEESLYLHLDKEHHQKNFADVLARIDDRLKLIKPKPRRTAENKLADMGRHPLWPDAASLSIF